MRDRIVLALFIAVAVVVLLVVLRASMDDDEPETGSSGAVIPPGERLLRAQQAIEDSGGYSITVQQVNFVLPQWGGADGGTVQVSADGRLARAELVRTGEPGATYTILYVDGQTYFRRSTCEETFRIPGGGGSVLDVFNLPKTKALEKAAGSATTAALGDDRGPRPGRQPLLSAAAATRW